VAPAVTGGESSFMGPGATEFPRMARIGYVARENVLSGVLLRPKVRGTGRLGWGGFRLFHPEMGPRWE
jgi:hypothetical protein